MAEFEGLMKNEDRVFDGALQELLNHATVEVQRPFFPSTVTNDHELLYCLVCADEK